MEDILKVASDEGKALAKEALKHAEVWLKKEVEARSDLPDFKPGSDASSELDSALSLARATRKSLEKKLDAKTEAEMIVKQVLEGAVKIAMQAILMAGGKCKEHLK